MFLGINLSLSRFPLHFPSHPSFPSEGVLLKIRPGGFFNVSLEVGFFFSLGFVARDANPTLP